MKGITPAIAQLYQNKSRYLYRQISTISIQENQGTGKNGGRLRAIGQAVALSLIVPDQSESERGAVCVLFISFVFVFLGHLGLAWYQLRVGWSPRGPNFSQVNVIETQKLRTFVQIRRPLLDLCSVDHKFCRGFWPRSGAATRACAAPQFRSIISQLAALSCAGRLFVANMADVPIISAQLKTEHVQM